MELNISDEDMDSQLSSNHSSQNMVVNQYEIDIPDFSLLNRSATQRFLEYKPVFAQNFIKNRRIMVVDDEPYNRAGLMIIL